MSAGEMKPCPFCGEKNEVYLGYRTDGMENGRIKLKQPPYQIDCVGCGIEVTPREGNDAIAAWNRRPAPPLSTPAPGVVEALTPEQAWQNLTEKDDRTSPDEYPEMALITREELAGYMALASIPEDRERAPVTDAPRTFEAWFDAIPTPHRAWLQNNFWTIREMRKAWDAALEAASPKIAGEERP